MTAFSSNTSTLRCSGRLNRWNACAISSKSVRAHCRPQTRRNNNVTSAVASRYLGDNRLRQNARSDLERSVGLRLQRVKRFPGRTVGIDDVDLLFDLAVHDHGFAKLEASVP